MKLTLSQLKKVINTLITENESKSEEHLDDLTVVDEEHDVEAVLSFKGGENNPFELKINDIEYNDPNKIAAVVAKAYFDLADYVSDNPQDKNYVANLHKIIDKTIDGGVESLKATQQNRLVIWNLILQKIGRNKDRNS